MHKLKLVIGLLLLSSCTEAEKQVLLNPDLNPECEACLAFVEARMLFEENCGMSPEAWDEICLDDFCTMTDSTLEICVGKTNLPTLPIPPGLPCPH